MWDPDFSDFQPDVLVDETEGEAFRDRIRFLYAPPRCLLKHTTTESTANGNDVIVNYGVGSEIYDDDAMHDESTANVRITSVEDGRYAVAGLVQWGGGNNSRRSWILTSTGEIAADQMLTAASSGNGIDNNPRGEADLPVGAYLNHYVWHNHGSARDRALTLFGAHWIRGLGD